MKAIVDDGYEFTGWYSLGNTLLSLSQTYTVDKQYLGSVVAKTNSTEYDGMEPFSYSVSQMDADSMIWIITDWRTGEFVKSFTKVTSIDMTIHPGKYDIRIVGTKTNGKEIDDTRHEVVNGEVKKLFTWEYDGTPYSAVWTTNYSTYNSYQNSSVNRSPLTTSARMEFINYTSNTVKVFADYLNDQSVGMTKLERAQFVLCFVQQCIEYQYDSDYCGRSDYWKYPYETLYDGRGDCEDSTILYCALMKSMGYDAAMLMYVGEEYVGKGHASAGIAFDSVPGGTYYEKNGLKYYYCETTGEGWKVGEKVSGYSSAYVYVV